MRKYTDNRVRKQVLKYHSIIKFILPYMVTVFRWEQFFKLNKALSPNYSKKPYLVWKALLSETLTIFCKAFPLKYIQCGCNERSFYLCDQAYSTILE